MDMKQLLEAVTKFSGETVGQKPGDQVRGTEVAKPTKSGEDHPFKGRLVGGSEQQESVLKDLSKGLTPKTVEQELAEMWANFNEEDLGTHPKRAGRKSDRPSRGHKEEPRYKTVKTDEDYETATGGKVTKTPTGIIHKGKKYGGEEKNSNAKEELGRKDLWDLKHPGRPVDLGLDLDDDYDDLDEGATDQVYTVNIVRRSSFGGDSRTRPTSGTLPELIEYFGYTLETGKSYEHEKGRYKINLNPKNIQSLVDNLNKAKSNAAANGHSSTYYEVAEEQLAESHYKWEITFKDGKKAVYHHDSPHYGDATAASDIRSTVKSNPGATVVATKDGKSFDWESLLSEGWESGPEEYKEPYDDADDAYDHRRQDKLDAETEKEWAKRPQKKIYTLTGRGPNMEPNYKFPGEWDSQEAADAARTELMADPSTPHPEHIGIHSYTKYLDQTKESRGHKIVLNKLKDIERAKKFAKGELEIPTPQERAEELKKKISDLEQKIEEMRALKEAGANNPPQVTLPGTTAQTAQDAKKTMAATNALKAATGATAPPANLLKAIDNATQGKAVGAQDMKALEPMMDVVGAAAQDPKLANQFKTLAQQAKQTKMQGQQQQAQQK